MRRLGLLVGVLAVLWSSALGRGTRGRRASRPLPKGQGGDQARLLRHRALDAAGDRDPQSAAGPREGSGGARPISELLQGRLPCGAGQGGGGANGVQSLPGVQSKRDTGPGAVSQEGHRGLRGGPEVRLERIRRAQGRHRPRVSRLSDAGRGRPGRDRGELGRRTGALPPDARGGHGVSASSGLDGPFGVHREILEGARHQTRNPGERVPSGVRAPRGLRGSVFRPGGDAAAKRIAGPCSCSWVRPHTPCRSR